MDAPRSPAQQAIEIADGGTAGSGHELPFQRQLQSSFGPYDLSSVRVHKGAAARSATSSLSAAAYTRGENIVLGDPANLHTLAHEAAHVVQQRQPGMASPGLSQPGGSAEARADAVADRVVQGRSAVDLLTGMAPRGGQATGAPPPPVVQRKAKLAWWRPAAQQRVTTTIDWLASFGANDATKAALHASSAAAADRLRIWKSKPPADWEPQHIGESMHIGSGGQAEARQLRRAIILIRAALLRHDAEKAGEEVKDLAVDKLQQIFGQVLAAAAGPAPARPQRLEQEHLARKLQGAEFTIGDKVSSKAKSDPSLRGEYDQRLYAKRDAFQQDLNNYTATMRQVPRVSFVPSRHTDTATEANKVYLNLPLVTVGNRVKALGILKDGGELFVVGHGNFGSSIGPHMHSVGEKTLVRQLEAAGLPKEPTARIELYLWSCWAATHTRRAYGGIGKRNPFAARVAAVLAQRGFTNYHVIGFAGTVAKDALYQDVRTVGGREIDGKDVQQEDHYSIYEVNDGSHNRIAGTDHTSKMRPGAGGTVYTVRRRGGTHNR